MSGSRILEVTVVSAEDLTVDRKPVAAKNVFVEVRAESLTSCTTSPAADGGAGGNPSWKETVMVEIPAHARSITFEVKSKTKSVGIARIALSDFLGGIMPENCLQFLSYRLRDWEGRRNGIINFSARVKSPPAAAVTAAPSCGRQMRTPMVMMSDQKSGHHGVVTGIPVGWNMYASNV